MAAENKKTLYHGKFRELGPVRVTVKKGQQPSKYKNRRPYVTLEINGEEKYYETENDACAAFFDKTEGRTFTVVADGTREDAKIVYVGEGAATAAAGVPPAQQQNRSAAPAANHPPPAARVPPAAGVKAAKEFVGRNMVFAKICTRATLSMVRQYRADVEEDPPEALVVAWFNSCAYGGSRVTDGLPVSSDIDFKLPKPQTAEELAAQRAAADTARAAEAVRKAVAEAAAKAAAAAARGQPEPSDNDGDNVDEPDF